MLLCLLKNTKHSYSIKKTKTKKVGPKLIKTVRINSLDIFESMRIIPLQTCSCSKINE